MPKVEITFAESAVIDLESVQQWYVSEDATAAGERLIQEIFVSIEQLAQFPEMGRIVPEFDFADLREILHSPVRIVYRHDANRVRIVRIWRSERLLKMP